MISTQEAKQLILNSISIAKIEEKFLTDSVSNYLSEDIISPINMPPFRQSAMDGYALCLHDLDTYEVIDEIKAGDGHHPRLKKGEAVRIFTGAAVPDDANAVVMQERVISNNNRITVTSEVALNANIRPLGEQVQQGAIALKKGTCLTAAAIGFLASIGIEKVSVFKKPSIAIVVTGNELVEVGNPLSYGKIYESNSIMLQSALQASGFTNAHVYKVPDDYNETLQLLDTVITKNDVVLVTGGISVGDYDFVGKALKELNVNQLFYKVKQKPGKPLFFGKKENTSIFALPGNPAAALSCFYIYVYAALKRMSGIANFQLKESIETSTSAFTKRGDRAQFLKAIYKEGKVSILEGQSSAMLQTFALANAFVYVPEDMNQISIGDKVQVIHIPN
ncbi:molybdopterin molybdotransferase MoeA [Kordia sp.]|uniref:molybdopterin molybdotransferase MoeA n=1 Tax=Kordia sp. TaxID=1965332 RepID=UPI003D6C0EB1